MCALVNWFEELPLYLQVTCGEHVVWASNTEHLESLEQSLNSLASLEATSAGDLEMLPLPQTAFEFDQLGDAIVRLRELIEPCFLKKYD